MKRGLSGVAGLFTLLVALGTGCPPPSSQPAPSAPTATSTPATPAPAAPTPAAPTPEGEGVAVISVPGMT